MPNHVDSLEILSDHAKQAIKSCNDILESNFDQRLVWFTDKHKSIRWRVISRDDPFWKIGDEWSGKDIDKAA